MTTPRALLERAHTVLLEEGWHKRSYGHITEASRHCIIGSLYRAYYLETGLNPLDVAATASPHYGDLRAAEGHLHAVVREERAAAVSSLWNDQATTTIEDVAEVLTVATKRAIRVEELS